MPNTPLIQNRDIIVVGQQPWDVEIGSNCKNIAEEFAKHNRVLYVNAPLDRNTLRKQKADAKVAKRLRIIQGKEPSLVLIKENLWNLYPDRMIESINWVGSQTLFEWLNRYNNQIFSGCIKKAVQQLGFNNIILFNDNDMFRSFHLPELLKATTSVYYSRDYMLAVDYWKKHGEKMEPQLIAKSHVCVANSTYLANYCKKFNPHAYYVGQGCELSIFTYIEEGTPNDIKGIATPIIGYVGALQSLRLNIDTIAYIAESHPEWSVVLVGPEDDEFKASRLHQISNIHFLGSKPAQALPAYIQAFQVCINPQIVNQVTIGNYPRKIDEYLAVGKPVVATKTEAMHIFSDYTYLADSKEEYVYLINKALTENNEVLAQQRKQFALSHTWENSVADIYQAILSVQK